MGLTLECLWLSMAIWLEKIQLDQSFVQIKFFIKFGEDWSSQVKEQINQIQQKFTN